MASVKEQFEAAQSDVKTLKSRPDNDVLLQLYSLFKQATAGDASGKRPGMFDLVGRAKYDAWAKHKGTSADEAMRKYVDLVAELKRAQG